MKPKSNVIRSLDKIGYIERIKYVGVMDFASFLKAMHHWYIDHEYEFHETVYKHKVPTPAGAEQEIKWTGWRKITPYVRYWVDVFIHTWDMQTVDIVKDGKKVKGVKCRLLVEFSGKVELDWSERFGGSVFLQNLQDWYHKYILKKDIEDIWEDELYYRVLSLYSIAKKSLEIETSHEASARRTW